MKTLSHQRGIALLEAMLATVILAIGLLGTIGMQARAYSALSEASMRTEATLAAESLLGIISTDLAHLSSYAYVAGAVPSTQLANWYGVTRTRIPGAVVNVTITAASGTTRNRVDIAIGWTRKTNGPLNRHTVTAYVSP